MKLDANRQKILDIIMLALDADRKHGHHITKQHIRKRGTRVYD